MNRLAGALLIVATLAATVAFAAANAGERVTLNLGIVVFYRVPLSLVILGAVFLGMFVMVLVGVESDLKVRRILRERLHEEHLEEQERMMPDPRQRDLFNEETGDADP